MRNIKKIIGRVSLVMLATLFLVSFTKDKNKVSDFSEKTLSEKIVAGKQIYIKTCLMCHQANGAGIANAFPPLAKSDYLNADVNRAISTVLYGKTGNIVVNGSKYNSVMTPQNLTDEEVANVLTYVYNSWGNNKTNVKVSLIKEVKKND